MNKKYLILYDFRILPISLGDIIQWTALKKLESNEKGYEKVDLLLIYCINFKGNLINELKKNGYWDEHYKEVYRIFDSTKFISTIIENDGEVDFDASEYENGMDILNENNNNLINIKRNQTLVLNYIRKHQSFRPFNEYFIKYEKRIVIESKDYVVNETIDILKSNNISISDLIICQPRFRMVDRGIPYSDPYRDSSYLAWAKFFKAVGSKCILLGRIESIPNNFKRFNNVIFAREIGLNLGHELALVRNSNLVLAASSGFAICAHFSKVPYVIFGVMKPGFLNYELKEDSTKLIFSNSKQYITSNEIDFNNMMELEIKLNKKEFDISIKSDQVELIQLIISDYLKIKKIKRDYSFDKLLKLYSSIHDIEFINNKIFAYYFILYKLKLLMYLLGNYKNMLKKQIYYDNLLPFLMDKIKVLILK